MHARDEARRGTRRALLGAVLQLSLVQAAAGQELIVNGGFEAYSRCPPGIGVIDGYVDSWYRGGQGSTDYLNECGYYPVPSRNGKGHAGLIPWDASGPYREYLVGELVAPLDAGVTYHLELWVILSAGHLRAVQELGAWFSPTRPTFPGTGPPAGVVPQVEHADGPITDKVNWTLVSGDFTAAGGESFLTIGNFHDDAGTTLFEWPCCGSVQSYYYVDDVSLVEVGGPRVSATCTVSADTCPINAAASGDGRRDLDELVDVQVVLTNAGPGDVSGYTATLEVTGATIVLPAGGAIDVPFLGDGQSLAIDVVLQLPAAGSGASCGDGVDLRLTGQVADGETWPDDELDACTFPLGDALGGDCGHCDFPPCLWRADASLLQPLTPPASSLFMPPTSEGLSLQGPSWQCPLDDGDLESDANALSNGVPLSFYQVDVATDTLRLEKLGTTIRFRR